MTDKFIPDPLPPLGRGKHRPVTAEVLRRLLEAQEAGQIEDLWLQFPQSGCCFSFGPNKDIPLPIGALFLLWSAGSPFVQVCPHCGSQAHMIGFRGLLSFGGGGLVCTGCGLSFFQRLGGGLGGMAHILSKSPLAETPFQHTGMCFGGGYYSDGAQLCDFLGVEIPPDDETADDGVSLKLKGKNIRFYLGGYEKTASSHGSGTVVARLRGVTMGKSTKEEKSHD